LAGLGLKVLRFNRRAVLTETDAVLEIIYQKIVDQMDSEIPPNPPFLKGGMRKEKKV
jgi:hypothetical protein